MRRLLKWLMATMLLVIANMAHADIFVNSQSATNITASSATLNADIEAMLAFNVSGYFQYGTTGAYGSGTPGQAILNWWNGTVSATITGLACNTTYHFRLNTDDRFTAGSNDTTFTTSACPAASSVTNPSTMSINGTSEATDALYPGNFASPVANPIHFTYSFPGCTNGELTLAMSAPALGLPWSYLDSSLHWKPLPSSLDQITPFVPRFSDNGMPQELFSGSLPPGIYDFFLVCDSRNGHLDIQMLGTGPALTGMYVHRRIMVY